MIRRDEGVASSCHLLLPVHGLDLSKRLSELVQSEPQSVVS
jgi:hypothetical protein